MGYTCVLLGTGHVSLSLIYGYDERAEEICSTKLYDIYTYHSTPEIYIHLIQYVYQSNIKS